MNKLIYILAIPLFLLLGSSCTDNEDSDQQEEITSGIWNYQKPHFIFEYATDSVTVQMGRPDKTQSWAVKDLNRMAPLMLHAQLNQLFQGIEFFSADSLKLNLQLPNGMRPVLRASYLQNDRFIEIQLHAADLAVLAGKIIEIPKISLSYTLEEGQLKLYVDKTYISVMASMMMDQILQAVIPSIIPNYASMPEFVKQMILKSFKVQVMDILQQTRTLEVGIILQQV